MNQSVYYQLSYLISDTHCWQATCPRIIFCLSHAVIDVCTTLRLKTRWMWEITFLCWRFVGFKPWSILDQVINHFSLELGWCSDLGGADQISEHLICFVGYVDWLNKLAPYHFWAIILVLNCVNTKHINVENFQCPLNSLSCSTGNHTLSNIN